MPGGGPSLEYLRPHRCTEKGGPWAACRGNPEMTGETFPVRQAGRPDHEGFSGLQFSDSRKALMGFWQRNINMGVFSEERTRAAEMEEGELKWAEPRQVGCGLRYFRVTRDGQILEIGTGVVL